MNTRSALLTLGSIMTVAVYSMPRVADAQILERLIMPGPVVEGHAEFEQDCEKCHTSFKKASQSGLCRDCHEAISQDLDKGMGLHGRNPRIGERECVDCHTEHEGRNGIISPVTSGSFRHDQTDFMLEGAHAGTDCAECHLPGKPRREAPGQCIGCHKEDDAHDGRLGEDCAQCHTPEAWQKNVFDHAAQTEFALEGAHAQVSCVGCHGAETHEDTPSECVACHARDDVHAGVNGEQCQQCHGTEGWSEVKFDHERDGRWPLLGKHAEVGCELCHTVSLTEPKLEAACVSCHRSDDVHLGKNGTQCQDCHGNDDWRESRFDHAKTDFALRGKHQDVPCVACHRGSVEDELPLACVGCHEGGDVHRRSLGERCELCHGEEGWLASVRFDHDLSNFPLIGHHAVVSCEQCHADQRYRETSQACVDCHGQDDSHQGSLGDQCQGCHNPNGWGYWTFDHATQTDFPLENAHAEVACRQCHRPGGDGTWVTPRDCGSCHRKDDRHQDRFGRDCGRCHTTASFGDVRRLP